MIFSQSLINRIRHPVVCRALWLTGLLLLSILASAQPPDKTKTETAVLKESVPQLSVAEIQKVLDDLNQGAVQTYKIGPSDKFDFYMYDDVQQNVKGLIVRTDGLITVPMVGDVKVEGLTVDEAKTLIETKYKKYYKSPIISLIPVEVSSGKFTILGKVVMPGMYPITKGLRLLDAIGIAQGLAVGYFKNNTVEMADLEHAFIIRHSKVLPIDFIRLIREGDTRNNIPLQNDDYIYIPSVRNQEVFVIGEVNAPSSYLYRDDLSLSQVFAYAEGYKPIARLSDIRIIRGVLRNPEVFKVDYTKVLSGKAADFRLQPGDVIFVPKTVIGSISELFSEIVPPLQAIYMTKQLSKK